jgi:uncharacterized protein (TIGR03437 family)
MVQRMRRQTRNLFSFPVILSFLLLSMLGRIDTAQAQGQDSLTVSPSFLTFASSVGGPSQMATIQVGTTAAPLNYTVTSASSQNWFVAYTSQSITPGQITVAMSPGQLGVGTYTGTVTITPTGASTTPVVIPVSLVISTASALTVSPTSMTFSATAGSTGSTAPQTLSVNSATNGISFSETVTYGQANLPTWLQVTPTSAVTNASLAVTANPSGLVAGSYSANISLSTGQGTNQVVAVVFTVTGLPTLSSTLSSIPFYYQIGQSPSFASSAFLTINTGNNSSVPISLTTSTSSCPGFLGVSQQGSLVTPATIQVFATNLQNFSQSQTCNGTITVTSSSTTNSSITIPVTLTVSNSPLVIITPSSASFNYQFGGTLPANQNLTISSTTSGISFSASSSALWLAVTPSGITGTSSQISLNLIQNQLAALIPNTYSATITVVAAGASNSPLTIPVTLTISPNSMLTLTPSFANFVYEVGQQVSLNSQTIQIGTTGGQIPFTISVPTTTGTQFFTVSPTSGTAPATVVVTALPGALSAGVYNSYLGVSPTSGGTPLNLPVQLSVSGAGQPQLNISQSTLSFNFSPGQTVSPQTIFLTSTDPTLQLTISSVTANASWLNTSYVQGSNLTTPQNLSVTVNPIFLTPSPTPYTANLVITTTSSLGVTGTTTIPVTLNYTSGVTLTATPTTLAFSQVTNGATPAAMSLNVGASGVAGASLPFSASASTVSGGNWLSATPTAGTAPGTISVALTSVAASLSPGNYLGSVIIFGSGAANPSGQLTVPVTLTVTSAPTLVISTGGLTFAGAANGVSPTAQTFTVTAPNAISSVTFSASVATTTGGNWLTVSGPLATPATITASANISGLAASTYMGSITLTPSGGGAATVIPVSLTITAQITPAPAQVINAASGVTGSVAPGEIVSIFGTGLGPVNPAGLTLNGQGAVTTTLAGVTVSFNGIAAPLTYVSATQINCVVPFEISGASTAQMQISFNGATSGATAMGVQATAPGIFTQNSSGTGLGAILKPDYSTVGTNNPAPRGSTVIIYATGGGLTTPNSITGAVAGGTLLNTSAKVTVTIGGIAATVSYAGSAPGLIEGVLQINAIVPPSISAGTQPILVTVGSATSQNGVTIPVQ